MSLPSGVFLGGRYLLKQGGTPTVVGGGKNHTLNISRARVPTFTKGNVGWDDSISGVVRWGVQADLEYEESGSPIAGCTLAMTVAGDAVLEVTKLGLSVECRYVEAISNANSCKPRIIPVSRKIIANVEAYWVDQLNDGVINAGVDASALAAFIAGVNGGANSLACVISFGADQEITFTGGGSDFTKLSPAENITGVRGQIEAIASPTPTFTTTGCDAGLAAIIADLFQADISDMAGFATILENTADGAGSTKWSGTGFCTSFQLDATIGESITAALELAGSGDLTPAAAT